MKEKGLGVWKGPFPRLSCLVLGFDCSSLSPFSWSTVTPPSPEPKRQVLGSALLRQVLRVRAEDAGLQWAWQPATSPARSGGHRLERASWCPFRIPSILRASVLSQRCLPHLGWRREALLAPRTCPGEGERCSLTALESAHGNRDKVPFKYPCTCACPR